MNQQLLWSIRRTGLILRHSEKAGNFYDLFPSLLAPRRASAAKRYFWLTSRGMLEFDEPGIINSGCLEINNNKSSKGRKWYSDFTQQGYVQEYECNNERRLINDWIQNLRESKYYFGEAVFVLGPMGAGKTTVLMEEFRKHTIYKDYAYVDTDELMEKLDGFDSERVEKFYPSARSIAIKLTDWLLKETISFVAEGTCVKYVELEDYMRRLKNNGYVIKVKHVNDVPLEEILKRTSKRKRKIPESSVESIYYGSLEGLQKLKKINKENSLFQEL